MSELILSKEMMSSIQISELTGKRHDAILRDIRNLLRQGVDAHNFVEVEYTDKKGEKRPCYELTKKGCLILASGYDAKLRERIIDRWEELETEKQKGGFVIPQSFSEALQLAANQAKQIEEQQKTIEQKEECVKKLEAESEQQKITIELQDSEIKKSAPKVDYYDRHLQSVNTQTSTQVAKQIGMDAPKLHKKLKEIGFIYKQSDQWMLHSPYSSWDLHSTRTQTFTRSDGSIGSSTYTVWKAKGVRFIIALYENGWNIKKAISSIKAEHAA